MSIHVCVHMNCSYTNELIRKVLNKREHIFNFIDISNKIQEDNILYWLEYEEIDFDMIYRLAKQDQKNKILVNSFCIRRGLLRKANFAAFLQKYLAKKPDSILRNHYPESHILELSHPDYLDEALNEAFELRDILEENTKTTEQPVTFILKASIVDKASELFLFTTQNQLEEYFIEKDDEEISSLREWIVQRYITNPKLLPTYNNRKFHLRVYVVAEKNLRIYVYDGILALFASKSYDNTDEIYDRLRHITNTCAQIDSELNENDLVKEFSRLEGFSDEIRSNIFEQIKSIVGEIFTGLHNEITIFQPLKNAFEIFGFDFLIDENNQVYFLEANAFPDFKQTGNELSILIEELFDNVVDNIIQPYFDIESNEKLNTQRKLHLVYEKEKKF